VAGNIKKVKAIETRIKYCFQVWSPKLWQDKFVHFIKIQLKGSQNTQTFHLNF